NVISTGFPVQFHRCAFNKNVVTPQKPMQHNGNTAKKTLDFFLFFSSLRSVWICGVTTFLLNAHRWNCTGNPVDMTFEHRYCN
ncbi:unnamed protein product, partial [Rotaria sordida]